MKAKWIILPVNQHLLLGRAVFCGVYVYCGEIEKNGKSEPYHR